jgi:hypothetical protein
MTDHDPTLPDSNIEPGLERLQKIFAEVFGNAEAEIARWESVDFTGSRRRRSRRLGFQWWQRRRS